MDILKTVLFSLLSFSTMFLICKMLGNRQISQMSMFDYINSITIGSIAAELATNLENWYRPLSAMLLYGFITFLVNYFTCKSLKLRKFLSGEPLVLMENGIIYKKNLMKVSIDINEFLTQCRVAGYFDLSQLKAVILETSGQFSFLPLSDQRPATPADLKIPVQQEPLWVSLIIDGKLLPDNLRCSGHNEKWLKEALHRTGIGQVKDVFFAACDESGKLFVCRQTEKPHQNDIFE